MPRPRRNTRSVNVGEDPGARLRRGRGRSPSTSGSWRERDRFGASHRNRRGRPIDWLAAAGGCNHGVLPATSATLRAQHVRDIRSGLAAGWSTWTRSTRRRTGRPRRARTGSNPFDNNSVRGTTASGPRTSWDRSYDCTARTAARTSERLVGRLALNGIPRRRCLSRARSSSTAISLGGANENCSTPATGRSTSTARSILPKHDLRSPEAVERQHCCHDVEPGGAC